ncbi:MAG TPA: PhoH family protein [Bacteroidales bacterium]|jgi:PhoH-like ATPase|nr:PhoH family protein [Bacteroidales bacterium]HOS71849.1 PhoH family protein [Bacteroidales bacterium]HQH24979.1 PhoH family protein [Bacteroidales bacterium]HQJ82610.1 PhoH family protein [Bacteroidales bacterium]
MAKKHNKKIFIIDTNVLLHDYKCIYNFEENDVIIPIVVLEELDRFKKGNDQINFHAREFTRELDKLSGDLLLTANIPLGENLGNLHIETGKEFSEKVSQSFPDRTPDHRILAIADYVCNANKNKTVVLITKDINLRMKAKSLGIMAQDYRTDKVANIDDLYKGISVVEGIDQVLINKLYDNPAGVSVSEFNLDQEQKGHKFFIMKNNGASALAHYNPASKLLNRVVKQTTYGIDPRNAEQTFALDVLTNPEIQLVSLTGKAGTGKTLLALAAALAQHKRYKQIFLARPIVPLANRDLGFLPGDIKDKMDPYMQPLYDNLTVIKHRFSHQSPEFLRINDMMKEEKLVITPLAYIRGRSLSSIFFIVDEAQNLTPHEIKTIITRAGEGTKMVFTGDIEQIDSPYLDTGSNGLSYLSDKMKDQDIFAHVNLVKGERSYLAELASKLL